MIFVEIDRDVHVAVSGAHPLGNAFNLPRAVSGDTVDRYFRCFAMLAGVAGAEHLLRLAAIAVHGESLAAGLIGQHVGLSYIVDSCVVGEIDGLGHRIIGKGLEGCLHSHVPLGTDVVGHPEQVFHPLGNVQVRQAARLGQLLH